MTITVWGKEDCAQCTATVRILNKKAVEFEYRDLTQTDVDRFRKMGFTSAPIVETENARWAGFRPDLLNEEITEAK